MSGPGESLLEASEAEQAVLGSMLIDPEAIWQVAPVLRVDDFYENRHRQIYKAIQELGDRGLTVDFVTLMQELNTLGIADGVGGGVYLSQLISGTPSSMNAMSYAGQIIEAARRRKGLDILGEISRRFYNAKEDIDGTITWAINALQEQGRGGDLVRACEIIGGVYDEMERNVENPLEDGPVRWLDTGWRDLNTALGGWKPGFYVTLGEPHVGKSWELLWAAANVAGQGKRVLFFSLEMRALDLMRRLCLAHSRLSQRNYDLGRMTHDQIALFTDMQARIGDWNLDISDEMEHAGKIIATIHREMRSDNPPDFIAIDYLGLITTEYGEENRNYELIALTRGLKNLARRLQVPIATAHQISDKAVDSRANKRPMKSDGYSTGGVS